MVREAAKVELIMPDGQVFRGKKRETYQKIIEIMGLTAEQFTQTAMIAQGDFLKLLLAESRERKKIFSRIFQTEVCSRAQEELKKRAGELAARLEENQINVDVYKRQDVRYASVINVMSVVFCIFTMPLAVLIYELLI